MGMFINTALISDGNSAEAWRDRMIGTERLNRRLLDEKTSPKLKLSPGAVVAGAW
jgi:hypothetical protein